MYINLGKKDQFNFNTLKGYIAEVAEVSETEIPWSDLKDTFSLFEVRTSSYDKVLEAMNNGVKYRGRTVRVESRGNKDEGIGRVRMRSNKTYSGGYENRSGGGGRDRDRGGDSNRNRGDRGERGGYGRSRNERASGGGERVSEGASSSRGGGWKFNDGGGRKRRS